MGSKADKICTSKCPRLKKVKTNTNNKDQPPTFISDPAFIRDPSFYRSFTVTQ